MACMVNGCGVGVGVSVGVAVTVAVAVGSGVALGARVTAAGDAAVTRCSTGPPPMEQPVRVTITIIPAQAVKCAILLPAVFIGFNPLILDIISQIIRNSLSARQVGFKPEIDSRSKA
ncbi:MAG: hypothetical protein D9V45_02865 [Chloroflexi bacterium]|nr:MAG: hypothetical protein D9V45_02865 [Chloroflexota bacterium]